MHERRRGAESPSRFGAALRPLALPLALIGWAGCAHGERDTLAPSRGALAPPTERSELHYALLWQGAVFHPPGGPRSDPPAGWARTRHASFVVHLVGEAEDGLLVETLGTSPEPGQHCGWVPPGSPSEGSRLARYRLRVLVDRDDAFRVTTRTVSRTFEDGSAIVIGSGLPVESSLGAGNPPGLHRLGAPVRREVRISLDEAEIGFGYRPGDLPRLFSLEEPEDAGWKGPQSLGVLEESVGPDPRATVPASTQEGEEGDEPIVDEKEDEDWGEEGAFVNVEDLSYEAVCGSDDRVRPEVDAGTIGTDGRVGFRPRERWDRSRVRRETSSALLPVEDACLQAWVRIDLADLAEVPEASPWTVGGVVGGIGCGMLAPPPSAVRAGARVFWPDGSAAGILVEDDPFPGTGFTSGALRCFEVTFQETHGALPLCFAPADVELSSGEGG